MSLNESADAPQRRRGAALESALLEAAWAELVERGYDGFTIESVAERAKTSRAVVYRRWPSKQELVHAAVLRSTDEVPVAIPDTGTLRGDLVALLRQANRRRAHLAVVFTARLGEYFAATGSSLAELRQSMLAGRSTSLDVIIGRAVERGEIDAAKLAAKLTPRIAALPFDLYRHELLMTYRPVPEDVIDEIVDQIFLPLVRP